MGTYKLYPKHSLIPALSEADKTLQAAQEMLTKLQTSIPEKAQDKINHNKAVEKLTSIFNQNKTQDNLQGLARVRADAPPQNNNQGNPEGLPRVEANAPPQRVTKQTSTTDPTDPTTLRTSKLVHNRQTRNNTPPLEPLPTIWETARQTTPPPAPGPH